MNICKKQKENTRRYYQDLLSNELLASMGTASNSEYTFQSMNYRLIANFYGTIIKNLSY